MPVSHASRRGPAEYVKDFLLTAALLQPVTVARHNPRHLGTLETQTVQGRAPKVEIRGVKK